MSRTAAPPVSAPAPTIRLRPSRRAPRAGPGRWRRRSGAGPGRGLEPIQDYPADPNEVIQALNGFKVEVVAKADRPTQGSWISITEDDQGRIILGANEQQPFTRLTLDKAGKVTKTETIFTPVSESMGITWHDNASTCRAAGSRRPSRRRSTIPGSARQSGQAGLHRLRDPKGDGSFTTVDTLRTWDGGEGGHSDHGIHEARVSPDGKHFYIINGNGVVQPDDVSPNSPLRNYADDRIIPLLGPQTGRLGQEKAPGGFIARTTFDGKDYQLVRGRPAQRAALRLECRRRDLHVRQRHGAGVRRAVVPAGARVRGCRAAPTSAIAATAANTRPGTRTRCRRWSRSASAARSA